ncbi:hypothetical protein BH10PLA2_BH10PLA2_31000 [soil metagenome]
MVEWRRSYEFSSVADQRDVDSDWSVMNRSKAVCVPKALLKYKLPRDQAMSFC